MRAPALVPAAGGTAGGHAHRGSRPALCPCSTPAGLTRDAPVEDLFVAFGREPAVEALYDTNVLAIANHLRGKHKFPLDDDDVAGIGTIFMAFYAGGPNLTYASQGAGRSRYPSYRDLQISTDGDGHTVTTTVGLADIDLVAVGQTATVTTPSTDASLTGTVSSIGVLDVSTTSEPSYTVEIALDATQERLFDGASAQVVVQVAGVDDVLTVPTSAVRTTDGATTVQVLDGDTPSAVEVEVGAVGAERTEILSGLSEGDEVVLADLDQPVEGASGSTSTGLSGLGDDQRGPVVLQGGPPAGFQGGPPSTRTGGVAAPSTSAQRVVNAAPPSAALMAGVDAA